MQEIKSILIVDDEENARYGLCKLLSQEGYEVDAVANGYQALDLLRRRQFHMVITDISMPEMNGLVFLREINRHYPSTHVVMVTAHGGVESYLEAMNLGALDYIHKPVRLDELKSIIEKLFGQGQGMQVS